MSLRFDPFQIFGARRSRGAPVCTRCRKRRRPLRGLRVGDGILVEIVRCRFAVRRPVGSAVTISSSIALTPLLVPQPGWSVSPNTVAACR